MYIYITTILQVNTKHCIQTITIYQVNTKHCILIIYIVYNHTPGKHKTLYTNYIYIVYNHTPGKHKTLYTDYTHMPGKHNTLYTIIYIAYNHMPGKHNTLHTNSVTISIKYIYNIYIYTQSLEVIIKVWVVLTALAFAAYMY